MADKAPDTTAPPATTDTEMKNTAPETTPTTASLGNTSTNNKAPDMSNILDHIKNLETSKQDLEKALKEKNDRIERLSAKTREGMQSALDTLMKKWMDAVETKDEKVKSDFKCGLETLVKNSAEDNGVWKMMVAASSLHEQQQHNLDLLQKENNELKLRVDGLYANPSSRIVGEKAKAVDQLDRQDVQADEGDIWGDFSRHIGSLH